MKTSLLTAAFLLGLLVGIGLSGHTQDGSDSSQDRVVLSGLAWHLDGKKHCNTYFTPGVGIEHPLSKNWALAVGAYDNSNCRFSSYVAGAWLPLHFSNWRLGSIAGLVSGYNNSVLPVAGLAASYQPKGKWGITALFIPPAGKTSNGVGWLQLTFPVAWLK